MAFSSADWIDKKADLAERLARGECGGSYPEAVLITCAAISAMAAFAWPGERIDRARFVELLVRHIPETKMISVPLLISHLVKHRRHVYARKLHRKFLPLTRSAVVTGKDVDCGVAAIRDVCRHLRVSEVRQFSYANLLYERLRSPITHEYRTDPQTVTNPMTDRDDAPVSYFNWIYEPGTDRKPLSRRGLPIRHIYFHIPWLATVARKVGKAADAAQHPLARPGKWWIHR